MKKKDEFVWSHDFNNKTAHFAENARLSVFAACVNPGQSKPLRFDVR